MFRPLTRIQKPACVKRTHEQTVSASKHKPMDYVCMPVCLLVYGCFVFFLFDKKGTHAAITNVDNDKN